MKKGAVFQKHFLMTLLISAALPIAVLEAGPFPRASFKSLEIVDLPLSGPRWLIDASRVEVKIEGGEQIAHMTDLKIRLLDQEEILISSEKGVFNFDRSTLLAEGRVLVTTSGAFLQTSSLQYQPPHKLQGEYPIEGKGKSKGGNIVLKGRKIVAYLNDQRVEIEGIVTEQQGLAGNFSVEAKRGTILFKRHQINYFEQVNAVMNQTRSESDEMRVELDRDNFSIAQAVALGNVKIESPRDQNRGEIRARCRQAFFFPNDAETLSQSGVQRGRLILEGRPLVWVDGDRMEGERISYWMGSNRVLVEKAKARVVPNRKRGSE